MVKTGINVSLGLQRLDDAPDDQITKKDLIAFTRECHLTQLFKVCVDGRYLAVAAKARSLQQHFAPRMLDTRKSKSENKEASNSFVD